MEAIKTPETVEAIKTTEKTEARKTTEATTTEATTTEATTALPSLIHIVLALSIIRNHRTRLEIGNIQPLKFIFEIIH